MPAEIINVVVSRNRDGWFVARSEELPGLFVAHPEIDAVMADIPNVIQALYKADFDQDVEVIAGSFRAGEPAGLPWVTIPAHIASGALR